MEDAKKEAIWDSIFSDPKYAGHHVIVADGKVYTAKQGRKAARILRELEKNHPDVIPAVTYLPPKGVALIV